MKYYLYTVFSQSVDRYYTGYTVDPSERLIEHNLGATPSIRPGIPILVCTEESGDKATATGREREIKKKSRRYIELLIHSEKVG